MKLTLKQMKFANEYIESGNATQAYLMAYKNVKKEEAARANASRLLTNANVKSYIDERMKKIEGDKIMSLTEIIQRLSEFGRGEAIEEQAMMDPVSGNPTIVKVKVKATTQLSAMRELLKRYPQSDELMNAQVRKAKAEADIAEYQAQQITNAASDVTKITVVDDIPKEEGVDDDNDKS